MICFFSPLWSYQQTITIQTARSNEIFVFQLSHVTTIALFCLILLTQLPLLIFQQIVPAHLATSPIPTESHLFWISEVEQRAAKALEDDPVDPDDPPEPPAPATVATKKKKRRRKKHKGDPRREELTPPMSVPTGNANAANASSATTAAMSSNGQNDEIFDMDLSSDDEAAARVSRSVYFLESLNKRFIFHHT